MLNRYGRVLFGLGILMLLASMPLSVTANDGHQDTLDPKYLISGATMSERECSALAETLWLVVDGRGDCVRYYSSGLKSGENKTIFVWFHGDLMQRHFKGNFFNTTSHEILGYRDNRPEILRSSMARWVSQFGKPAIFVARPGTYGSSGDHKLKRQPREVDLMNKALDGLKEKYRISSLIVAGQSGGGHITAAMLAKRGDIECAVLTSAAAAVRARNKIKKWPGDATGLTTFYDPIDHVAEIQGSATLRIFVVGDPRDTAVPFLSQQKYFDAVRARGLDAHLVRAKSSDTKRFHSLAPLGMRMAGWCASGIASNEIVRRAQAD
jgi:pimeloyl-ACP methyl ester carboxylesterase